MLRLTHRSCVKERTGSHLWNALVQICETECAESDCDVRIKNIYTLLSCIINIMFAFFIHNLIKKANFHRLITFLSAFILISIHPLIKSLNLLWCSKSRGMDQSVRWFEKWTVLYEIRINRDTCLEFSVPLENLSLLRDEGLYILACTR